jgi:predicted metal-dependent phosphoesterase TrpH
VKIDLHVHTNYSSDSLTRPDELVTYMVRRGIDAVAVTDHNAIEGAYEAAALAPGAIIIGEEIATTRGEIIGLFISERIAPGLSPLETVAAIRAQGGLVYVPHPTDRVRGSTLQREALWEIMPEIDLIEVYNSRVFIERRNRQARQLAEAQGLRMGAGSDAHRARDIGLAYIEMPPYIDAAGFMAGLSAATVHGRLVGLAGRFSALQARVARGRMRS